MIRFSALMALVISLISLFAPLSTAGPIPVNTTLSGRIAPKIMIISFWSPEAQIWHDNFPTNLTTHAIPVPGLSPIYPVIYCNPEKSICQATTGESEINAASTLSALILSDKFDLRKTYFLMAGIAGVNPKMATLGSVALARYAVQVALQYEIDPRSMDGSWSSGYFSYGTKGELEYPTITYGTEVFELNERLRDMAYGFAENATLANSEEAGIYRAKYASMGESFAPAVDVPKVVKCDTATSDVYYSGTILSQAFENVTNIWTNGTGQYCMTAQEDNAALAVILRSAIWGRVDFSRVIVLRTGSNFDRPPIGVSDWEHLALADQNGYALAVQNIFNAGMPIVQGLLNGWECTFEKGVKSENYVGDNFGTLGGKPDFGLGSLTGGERVAPGGGVFEKWKITGGVRMLEMKEMERRVAFAG